MTRPLTAGLLKRRGNPGTSGRLLEKSVEAYLLALETINRLTITYRIETFCTLMCNAWELLLKARIADQAKDRTAIYYPKVRGERRRSLSLRDALEAVYPDERDSVRRNVERVAQLRDEAVHLFISDVPKNVLGLMQACVLNYYDALAEWFGVALADRVPVGMMSIVFDISPERLDLSDEVMRRRLGKDATTYLLELSHQIDEEHEDLGRNKAFAVQIEYRLALEKGSDRAAAIAFTDPAGAAVSTLRVARDPSTVYPYRETELVEELCSRLGTRVTTEDVRAVVAAHNVKKRNEWFYQGKAIGSPALYGPQFAGWFVDQVRRNPDFLDRARQKRRRILAQRRAARTA
jgi:hypothetical protein